VPKRPYEEHHSHNQHSHPQPTVHSHTVTIEEVVTLPAGLGVYPPTSNPPPFHRHHYHEPTHHEPPRHGMGIGQQPVPYHEAQHEERQEERPWYQVLKRRRSSVETSIMDLETAYESSSSSSSSTPASSVSMAPGSLAPRFRSGLDLLLESEQ
jgi:hypothetical protein